IGGEPSPFGNVTPNARVERRSALLTGTFRNGRTTLRFSDSSTAITLARTIYAHGQTRRPATARRAEGLDRMTEQYRVQAPRSDGQREAAKHQKSADALNDAAATQRGSPPNHGRIAYHAHARRWELRGCQNLSCYAPQVDGEGQQSDARDANETSEGD